MDPTKQQQQDHDLLVRMDEKLKAVMTQLGEFSKSSGERLAVIDAQKASKEDMRTLIGELKADIDKSFATFTTTLSDHEKRLRRVERWGFIAIGAVGLVEIIITAHGKG